MRSWPAARRAGWRSSARSRSRAFSWPPSRAGRWQRRILGGRLIGRPLSVRGSLARSRMSFWRVVVGSFIVAIPVAIAQLVLGAVFEATLGRQTDVSIVSTTLAAALVGAPLRLRAERHRPRRRRPVRGGSPVVPRLPGAEGSPRPWSRSSRRPRPCSSSSACRPVSISPCASSARSASAPNSGPAGLVLMTLGIMAGVFALGTLIYTALRDRGRAADRDVRRPDAGDVRPRPRPAGRRSRPVTVRPGRRRFRWLTIPMLHRLRRRR